MSPESDNARMDQAIFNMNLSVETISVYLLCCSLADSGTPITTRNLMEIWNSTEEVLIACLVDLEKKNILRRILSNGATHSAYRMEASDHWRSD